MENEMKFHVWNVFTNLNEFEYENADIIVEPIGEKKEQIEEMTRQEMLKFGYTASEIENELENGDFFVNVINSEEFDNIYSDGGFSVLNEQESTLFFLTSDSMLISTGYVFDESESKELQEFVSEKIKEHIEKDTDYEIEMD